MGAWAVRQVLFGVVGALAFSTAHAANDAADGCISSNPDTRIIFCTVLIESETSDLILAGAHSNRGIAYEQKGAYGSALKDYSQAIKYQPDSAIAYNNRCFAFAQMGKLDLALVDCQVALKLNPTHPEFLDSRGYVYLLSGKYAEATRDYDAALGLSPKLVTALYGRGLAKLKSGAAVSATKDFEAAKFLDPDIANKMAAASMLVGAANRPTTPTSAPVSPH